MLESILKASAVMNREVIVYRAHFDSALVVAALAAVLLPAYSQSSPITFERTYGGPADDLGMSAVQTSDGGYVVAGTTESFGAGGFDSYLVKTNLHGDTLWTRTYGGPHDDVGWSVLQTADGGYMVAGGTDTSGSGHCDIWIVKTDANGNTAWTRIYGGAQDDVLWSVEQTSDCGYAIAGWTSSFGAGGDDVWLIKTDSSGDTLWTRTFGGAGDDKGLSVQQTRDSGYIIAGVTWSFGAGGQDVWVIKTDAMGDTQWTRTFGGDLMDVGCSAQQTADGGYIVAGWTMSYGVGGADVWLIKTDANGDTLWTKTIGGSGYDEGSSVQQITDGGYIIVASTDSYGAGMVDFYLIKTDADGDTLWTRTFGGPDFDAGYSAQQTTDGGYVIAGQTYSFGAGLSDFYLIKTDENGNVAVAEPKSSPPRKPGLSLTCEPNPFSSSTVLHLTTGPLELSATHFRIYDVQGRYVRTLATSPATQAMWDGRNDAGRLLPSGTYLVRCDVAGEHATARLILQR